MPAPSPNRRSLVLAVGVLLTVACGDDDAPSRPDTGAPSDGGSDSGATETGVAETGPIPEAGPPPETGVPFDDLTPEQQAALLACEAETGNRSFEGCPIEVLCSSLEAADTVPITVTFEPLSDACPWTEKDELIGPDDRDNLSEQERNTRARIEQVRDLKPELEVADGEAAIFCTVDISVSSLREDGRFRYDDDLLFLFGGDGPTSGAEGGALLITRNASMPDALEDDVAELPGVRWPQYEWPKIVNIQLSNDNDELFCLDTPVISEEDPECGLPATQRDGEFFINLSDETAGRLGIRAALNDNYNLSLVLTGDNDPDIDCQHDGFTATVNVGFIRIPSASLPDLI